MLYTGYRRDDETGLDYALARYYDPRFGRFLQQDPLPDVVEQARARAVAAFTYEALAAAPAGWTSPEFEGREAKFDELINAGSIHNRLRAFDWAREEIAPAESTGSRVGNQASRSARKETVTRGATSFTGYAKASPALPGVIPATIVQSPSLVFGSDPSVWNLYSYVASNPLTRTDPDGRSGTVVGEIVGGLAGGLWELGRQACAGEDTNWRKVSGSAARGAVVGAMMGSLIDTGGASLPVLLGAGTLSNVAGGEAERLVTGEKTNFEDVANDVAGGLVVGLAAGLVPPVRPYAGAVPTTQAVNAVRKLTAAAEESSLSVADDGAAGVIRVTETEVRFGASVSRFRNQPGYAQHEISGRWYNVAKRENTLEQRVSVHGNLRTSRMEATPTPSLTKKAISSNGESPKKILLRVIALPS